jgi:putative SOS response-associated peptidase YedK
MPVILLQEDEEEWLNRAVIEPERLLQSGEAISGVRCNTFSSHSSEHWPT